MDLLISFLKDYLPYLICALLGGGLGAFGMALCAGRSNGKAYRKGRTDMEKLIRDRVVQDRRDDTPLVSFTRPSNH